MTSHCGRWRAASSAAAWHIAAVSEKFPDATTPTERSRAAASISPKSAAVRPELPITTATPASIAASVFALTAVAEVKSTSTSTPSSASRTLACTGTPSASPPSASPRSRPAADRLTAEPSARSGASSTAGTSARPVQPVAPAMQTVRSWVACTISSSFPGVTVRPEELPDVADEQIGRLHGGEVTAALEDRPVRDAVLALGERADGAIHREHRHAGWDADGGLGACHRLAPSTYWSADDAAVLVSQYGDAPAGSVSGVEKVKPGSDGMMR